MKIEDIRPTQFGAGFREVEKKAGKLNNKTSSELRDYLRSHPVEGVLGPQGVFYAVDGHHFALAAKSIGLRTVYIEVVKDYSQLTVSNFWSEMIEGNMVYLYKLGEGPISPRYLPKRLEDMIDDPYRSLASAVRKLGGFKKKKDGFSEFPWANFFREYIKIEDGEMGFQKAVRASLILAKSPLAKALPGYIEANDDDCSVSIVANLRKP